MANIDQSEPYIESIDVPSEARPGEAFSVTAKVGNRSTITVPQDGTCQSGILGTNVTWRTPVKVRVDGQEKHSETKCIDGSSGTKEITARLDLDPGTYRVTVEVLRAPENTVAEERAGRVVVTEGASDPAVPTTGDKLKKFFNDLADALGGTTQQVAFGMALAGLLLVVL